MFVNLFGEVYDCNGLGRLIGHLRVDSVADVWTSKFAEAIRRPDQNGFCLVRERQWQGRDVSAMARKTEQYKLWAERNGTDPVTEHALAATTDVEMLRRGARKVELPLLDVTTGPR
jgi:hypothetical protein